MHRALFMQDDDDESDWNSRSPERPGSNGAPSKASASILQPRKACGSEVLLA